VCVWDLKTLEGELLEGAIGPLTTVAYSPGGDRILAAGDNQRIHMWDAITLQEILTLTGPEGPVTCLAVSPDGRRLACADTKTGVHVWEAEAPGKKTGGRGN
jgi:WD40 repeat protein